MDSKLKLEIRGHFDDLYLSHGLYNCLQSFRTHDIKKNLPTTATMANLELTQGKHSAAYHLRHNFRLIVCGEFILKLTLDASMKLTNAQRCSSQRVP